MLFLDIDKIEDPVKRNAAISFINNFGQMPKQVTIQDHVLMCEMEVASFPGSAQRNVACNIKKGRGSGICSHVSMFCI